MTGTRTIEISEATYNALVDEAQSRGVSVEEWIQYHLPEGGAEQNGHAPETEETIGERLERKGLIGIIDSSQPIDPSSPPIRTPFFEIIAEKLRKQGLIIP